MKILQRFAWRFKNDIIVPPMLFLFIIHQNNTIVNTFKYIILSSHMYYNLGNDIKEVNIWILESGFAQSERESR